MGILDFAKKMVGKDEPAKPVSKKAAEPKAEAKADTAATHDSEQPTLPAGIVSLTPVLTEKAVSLQMTSNTYAFTVRPETTKGEIIQAVTATYNVKPTSVRTVQRAAKTRRRGRTIGATSAWKRAYVTLPAGKTIDLTV